jgi:hypothetical protein
MSSSFVFVPDSSPRETKFARPAAPAAAIASNAQDARRIPRRPDDHEVVPHHGPADRLGGEPVGDELALERRRVADEDVALAGAGVRDRLAGADRDELQVVLRELPLELRRDELLEEARVAHARRALHDERPLLQRPALLRLHCRSREHRCRRRRRDRQHDHARPPASRFPRHKLRPLARAADLNCATS